MPLFVLLLFTFVIDLSLFCLYNEWLHSLPTSLSYMAVATWYLCVLYISLVYHKKNLLFVIWTVWLCSGWTAAGQTQLAYGRGVRAPIFLVFLTVSIDGVVAVTGRLPFFELTGCTSMLPHLLWLVRWCMRLWPKVGYFCCCCWLLCRWGAQAPPHTHSRLPHLPHAQRSALGCMQPNETKSNTAFYSCLL